MCTSRKVKESRAVMRQPPHSGTPNNSLKAMADPITSWISEPITANS
jgi:hypothetical protein